MAIAFDAFSRYSTGNTTSTADFSWTHTPVGTPKGVLVFIVENNNTPNAWDEITGVTYGGVAMTALSVSPNRYTGAEDGTIYAYFLGSGIPTGAQTVSVNKTANLNATTACCFTVTAGSPIVEIVDADASIQSASILDPRATLSLGGRSCFCAEMIFSGEPLITRITPLSGWTEQYEVDLGVQTCGAYSYDTIGTADVTMGWDNAAAEDSVAIGVALAESAYIDCGLGSFTITGNGATFDRVCPVGVGSFALTGNGAIFDRTCALDVGAFAITGNGAVFDRGIALDVGSFSLTGNGAIFDRGCPMDVGVFAITGNPVTMDVVTNAGEPPAAWNRRRTIMSGNRR